MLRILNAYQISEEIVNAIALMYEKKGKCPVMRMGKEIFKIMAVVLHGDTLFVIILDYALRQTISGREEELGFKLRKGKS